MIEFKILDEAKQQFSAYIGTRRVTFLLWYSYITNRWSLDLSIDDQPVLHGRRVVTGRNLLAPFRFNIGIVFAMSDTGAEPGRTELPLGLVRLYHASQEELDATVSS